MPVAGMVVAAVWVRTDHQSPDAEWRSQWGNADVMATPGAPGGAPRETGGAALDDLLPEGARTVVYRSEHRLVRTTGGQRSRAEITDLSMTDPLTSPIMQITSGRAPLRAGEVFVTRSVADQLGIGVGDTLELERPDPVTWTVVGLGERRAWWGSHTLVLGPGTPFAWRDDGLAFSVRTVLVDLPADVTTTQLVALGRFSDGVAFAPGVVPDGTPGATHWDAGPSRETATVAWSWVIGAVVLTVVGIVIAAAFAAGARRQLATLGQLAANGAPPAGLRRVPFLQGTWTGVLGAVLGLVLAAVLLAAIAPHADRLLGRDVDPYTTRLSDLIPIVILGVAAATLAALVPARTTARIPVLAALAGRRPLRPVPTWLTITGIAVGTGGLALLGLAVLGANGATSGATVWALTAIIGGVAVLLGACAIAPGYVSVLEPLASRLHGSSRLAARSLARQRTRTGAVVSAVCATSALAIAASALVLAADAKDDDEPTWMRTDEVQLYAQAQRSFYDRERFGGEHTPVPVPGEVLAEVRAALPGAEVHQLTAAGVPAARGHSHWVVREFVPDGPPSDDDDYISLGGGPTLQVASVADATLLGLYDLPGAARRALDEDGVVAIRWGSDSASGGTATVALVAEAFTESSTGQPPAVEELIPPFSVDVVAQESLALGSLPRIFVTAEHARTLGLEPIIGSTVVRASRALTDEQRTAVQDAMEEYRDLALDRQEPGDPIITVNAETYYPSAVVNPHLLEALLTSAAFLLSLFVVAVSLALAAAETRDERDVLVVVGAPPPTMRRTSGRKALLLSLLGAALAVPVGFLPVSVFTAASDANLPLVFPWRVVALLLVAVPLMAAAVTTACSGLALRLRPVRVSTMALD
ncbi:MAG: hypothetical protein M3Q48_03120 [Actinomycetota bacterium]|nr:hypothetical protein [Actinomycetota bacterium]